MFLFFIFIIFSDKMVLKTASTSISGRLLRSSAHTSLAPVPSQLGSLGLVLKIREKLIRVVAIRKRKEGCKYT